MNRDGIEGLPPHRKIRVVYCYSGHVKRAVRNRRTLKLVLPTALSFLVGKRVARGVEGGSLVLRVDYNDNDGSVKAVANGRKLRCPVINLGPHSELFKKPGRVRVEYWLQNGASRIRVTPEGMGVEDYLSGGTHSVSRRNGRGFEGEESQDCVPEGALYSPLARQEGGKLLQGPEAHIGTPPRGDAEADKHIIGGEGDHSV